MSAGRHFASLAAHALSLAAALAITAHAQEVDCLLCHQALSKGRTVHPELSAACRSCHSAIDASAFPHKVTGTIAKGLTAEPPALCMKCHDARLFEGKHVHAPVSAGRCSLCHDPHSADNAKLLKKAPVALCLDCHGGSKKVPHVVAGISRPGHPLGDEKKDPVAADPLRPGNAFYCGSCHEPHASNFARLTRFDTKASGGYCMLCHKL